MENENKEILNEVLPVSDEEIEEVSGGNIIGNMAHCVVCKTACAKYNMIKYNNGYVCKNCAGKVNK